MTHALLTTNPEAERLKSLLRSSASLTEEAIGLARALGPDASGAVVAEVIGAEPWGPGAVGTAHRAAYLAHELGLGAAAKPLAGYAERIGLRFPAGRTALSVLSRFGSPGVDALLALLERTRDGGDRRRIIEALARVEVDDERIRALLLRLLAEDPEFAAPLLAQRGDWRAVPGLLSAFDTLDRQPVADCAVCAADHLGTIGTALLALGGTLTPEHRAKIDGAFEQTASLWSVLEDDWLDGCLARRLPAVRSPRPGRNDPCPCGSGKKYKRCCLGADRRARQH